jgi:hypothetical protein
MTLTRDPSIYAAADGGEDAVNDMTHLGFVLESCIYLVEFALTLDV